jgi:penicillin amidase
MPSVLNPGSGVIATANSRVTPDSSPLRLSADWISPYRTERISKWLGGKERLAREDMLRLQNDVYSEVEQELAQRFAYAIERSAPGDSRLMQAASLLRRWDGSLTTDSAAASIAVRALEAFWPLVLEPRLGPAAARYVWGMKSFAAEEMIMHAPAQWLPPGCPDWDTLLTQAVRNGLRRGHAPRDLNEWRYGGWHQVELEHPLFGLLPGLRAATGSGTHPLSGDATTVKQVGRSFGPSQRFTMDWSDVDGATENLVMGESGNPLSPYYRDQWELWYAGRTFPLPYSRQAVAGATRHRLVLVP